MSDHGLTVEDVPRPAHQCECRGEDHAGARCDNPADVTGPVQTSQALCAVCLFCCAP